jgi:tRNA(Ile)-lysidine synthase
MALTSRVLHTIRRHALLRRGDAVLVALSGGPDSVALLHLLRELEAGGELTVAGVAHLNHGLRENAARDEAFCRALAEKMGIPFRAERADVADLAARLRTSLEDAGRQARYEFFDRVAVDLGAAAIATGHTRDDQAETFLLRLVRGAGPRGLASIYPRSGKVIRPLLDVGREELRTYLASMGEDYCDDETNRDLRIPRNRIRHELLPYLQREFSPGITDVLAREAAIARDDEDRLHQEAIEIADLIVLKSSVRVRHSRLGGESDATEETGTVEVDAPALAALHPALGSRVARLALALLAPTRFIGFEHVERFLELARSGDGALSLPGQHAVRRGTRLVLNREPFRQFENSFRVPLSIPGEVILEAQGWAVSAESGAWHSPGKDGSRLAVGVQADRVAPPLAVRSRRPGDRFRPTGMRGQGKKLQDFLVDRKVAREMRDLLPLVVDSSDTILWVVGESVSEDFRVTEPSQGVILLKARRLGGPG